MNTGLRLFQGSSLQVFNLAFQVAVSFFMLPFLIHNLGDRMYGFWVLVGDFIAYYNLLDLGLSSAVSRYFSHGMGEGDEEAQKETVRSSMFLFGLLGVLAILLTLLVVFLCPIFIPDKEESGLFREVFLVMGIAIALGFPAKTFHGILISHLRFDLTAAASMGRVILQTAAVVYCVTQGYGLFALALATAAASVFEYACLYFFARRFFPPLRLEFHRFKPQMTRELLKFGGKGFVAQIADLFRFKADTFVIAGMMGLSLVTPYSVSARLIEYYRLLIINALGVFTPIFSRYVGSGDREALLRQFRRSMKLNVVGTILIALFIAFYGHPFLTVWIGENAEASYKIALILVAGTALALMQNPAVSLLFALKQHHYFMYINLGEAVANLAISLALAGPFGIYGVAWGTTITMTFTKLLIQPYFVCKAADISLRDYYLRLMLVPALMTFAAMAPFFLGAYYLVRPSYLNLALIVTANGLYFLPIFWFAFMDREDRETFGKIFLRRAAKPAENSDGTAS